MKDFNENHFPDVNSSHASRKTRGNALHGLTAPPRPKSVLHQAITTAETKDKKVS